MPTHQKTDSVPAQLGQTMRLLGLLTEARVTDRPRYHEKVLLSAYTSQKKSYTTKQSQAPINIPLLQPARTCVFGAEKTEVSGDGLHALSPPSPREHERHITRDLTISYAVLCISLPLL